MPLYFEPSEMTPNYGDDQYGNSQLNGYTGYGVINGKRVIVYTDSSGYLQQASSIPTSATDRSQIELFDSNGNSKGFSVYDPKPQDNTLNVILGVAAAYFLPGVGSAIAAELGVSQAVGMAIAQVGSSVVQGVPIDKAIQNAGINLVTQGVMSQSNLGQFVNQLSSDPATRNIINNVASSTINTIAKGGTGQDILTNGLSAVVGTVTGQKLDSQTIGQAVATALATGGDPLKVANSIASSLGNEAAAQASKTTDKKVADLTQSSVQSNQASSGLDQAVAQAGLTPEEQEIVRQAKQEVFAQASTAQALPAFSSPPLTPYPPLFLVGTATDAPTGTSRIGSSFASNDPRFQAILEKNPSLSKAFDEYTNTYGFSSPAMNVGYIQQLKEELAKDPTNQTFLDEYKKVTGLEYQAAASPTPTQPPIVDVGEMVVTAPRIVASVDPTTNIAVLVDNTGKSTSIAVPPNTAVGSYVQVNPATQTATVVQPSPFVTGGINPTQIPEGPQFNPIQAPAPFPTTAPSINPTTAPSINPATAPSINPATAPSINPATAPATAPQTAPQTAPITDPATSPLATPQVGPIVGPQVGPQVGPAVDPLLSPAPAPVPQTGPVPAQNSPFSTPSTSSPFVTGQTAPSPFVTGPSPDDTFISSTTPGTPISTTNLNLTPQQPITPTEQTPAVEQKPEDTPTEQTPAVEQKPEEPKKPDNSFNISVSAIKPPKKKTPLPTITGFGRSPLEQALSAYRPPGEVEGESGIDRQNVWNEASLRLKDALGI